MTDLPTGTVTFLFTDIEGSTRLLDELGDQYAELLAEHHRLMRGAAGHVGDVDSARPFYEECLDTACLVGEPWYVAVSLVNLAEIKLTEEEYDEAANRAREALAVNGESAMSGMRPPAKGSSASPSSSSGIGTPLHNTFAQRFRKQPAPGFLKSRCGVSVGIAALDAEELPERAAAIIRAVEAWCGDVGYELGVHEQRLYDESRRPKAAWPQTLP